MILTGRAGYSADWAQAPAATPPPARAPSASTARRGATGSTTLKTLILRLLIPWRRYPALFCLAQLASYEANDQARSPVVHGAVIVRAEPGDDSMDLVPVSAPPASARRPPRRSARSPWRRPPAGTPSPPRGPPACSGASATPSRRWPAAAPPSTPPSRGCPPRQAPPRSPAPPAPARAPGSWSG